MFIERLTQKTRQLFYVFLLSRRVIEPKMKTAHPIIQRDRTGDRHGGVCAYVNKDLFYFCYVPPIVCGDSVLVFVLVCITLYHF